jgi:hypothetical protein
MKYEDVIPINPYVSTVWLIEFNDGEKHLAVWHIKAKIEDVVEATRTYHPGRKFKVTTVDVGTFVISQTLHALSNGRGVNQDLEMEV